MPSRRELSAFLLLAIAVRALVAWRTLMPSRDGVSYLWMAEQIAKGDLRAALSTVFHPLYPLLTGGVLAVGWPWSAMAAGQVVAAVCAASAIVPLQRVTAHQFGLAASRYTAWCYAVGLWFVRYPAECLSEGCFYLAAASVAALVFGARPRPRLAGVAVALAYATRPEAVLLVGMGWLHLRRQQPGAVRPFLLTALVGGCALPFAYAACGAGFTFTPKASFNYAVGVGAAGSPIAHYLHHALRVPGTAFEAIGYLVFPLATVGCIFAWRGDAKVRAGLLLALPLALQALIVPLLRNNARFLSGFGILLLPLAGFAVSELVARRGLRLRLLVAALLVAPDVFRLPAWRGEDRRIERQLGEWLRGRLGPGDSLVTEMPRLEYFAGVRPGPPRALTRAELLSLAAVPRARFVVLVGPRSQIDDDDLQRLSLQRVSLPEPISGLARERQLLVYERR